MSQLLPRRLFATARLSATILGFAVASLLAIAEPAAAPVRLAVQGLLTSSAGGPVADGVYGFALRLYDAPDAQVPVFEQKLLGVPVSGGAFAVTLGGDAPAEVLDSGLFFSGQAQFFAVQVDAEPELPRQPLRAVPYAVVAQGAKVAEGLSCSGCVDAGMLAAGSVGSAQLQAAAVNPSHVAFTYAASQTKGGAADVALVANEAGIAAQALKADAAAQAEELACTGCVTLNHLHPDVATGFVSTKGGTVDGQLEVTDVLAMPGGATATSAGVAGLKIAVLDVGAAACGASNKGQIALGSADSALYFCNGSAWRKLAGCEGVCPLAASVACGQPVVDDCGEPCVGGDTGTLCPQGASCGVNGCAFPLGAQTNPAVSCKAIKTAGDDVGDKAYWLDPDGDGGAEPFEAWCDMTTDGGGWTLVLKVKDGDVETFKYNSALWSNADPLNLASLDPTEDDNHKSPAYASVPLTEVRLDLATLGNSHTVSTTHASALQLFVGGALGTPYNRAQFLDWTPEAPSNWNNQLYCNVKGFQVSTSGAQCRYGIIMNNENNCSSSDSAVGFGCQTNNYAPGRSTSAGAHRWEPTVAYPEKGWIFVR